MSQISPNARLVDVAVVGGGPAGAMCALILAQGGAQVTLVNRGTVQCGAIEHVSGRARRLIEQHIDSFAFRDVNGVEVFETVSLWNTPTPTVGSAMCNPWGAGVAVDRSVFDTVLCDFASRLGVTVLEDTQVQIAERSQGLWQLTLFHGQNMSVLYANFLVIATGRSGTCPLGRNSVTSSSQVALMARMNTERSKAGHTLYVEAVDNGWWYMLPDSYGNWFIGFCTRRDEVKQRTGSLYAFWNRQLQKTRLLTPLLSNAVIVEPIIGRRASTRSFDKIADRDWIAVGDAAFAPDPLSGKGIEFGIESAALAARLLLTGIRSSDLQDYTDWICEYARQHEQLRAFFLSDIDL